MTNNPTNQTIERLAAANNVLIIVGNAQNIDSACSGLALHSFLSKQEKQVTVLTAGEVPHKINFLSQTANLKKGSVVNKNLVIDVDLSNNDVSELRYQKLDNKLSIFLTAKENEFTSNNVKVRDSVYPYDIVVTVGVANLEELGNFYAKNAQLFFQTLVVNIDHKPSNENYGQINLVNLIATANSEVILDLLEQFDQTLIDEPTATLLLTGLVAATNSFQSIKTTPQVFSKASKLINLGAKQQEIVSQLYRNKSLGFLRLWGRMLARVKIDEKNQIVYSMVGHTDIDKSQAKPEDVENIIAEMIEQLQFARTFVFLAEELDGKTTVFVSTNTHINLQNLFKSYNPAGHVHGIKFLIFKPLLQAEDEPIKLLQTELSKHQG